MNVEGQGPQEAVGKLGCSRQSGKAGRPVGSKWATHLDSNQQHGQVARSGRTDLRLPRQNVSGERDQVGRGGLEF